MAVAVVMAGSCSSDSTPSLGKAIGPTSVALKRKKKKKRKKEETTFNPAPEYTLKL